LFTSTLICTGSAVGEVQTTVMKPEVANEIARLMRDPDALRHEWDYMQRLSRRGHYDPNQPRVPAGHSDGGQWTTTGGRPASSAHDRAPIDQGWEGPSLADIAAGQPPIERVEARIWSAPDSEPVRRDRCASSGLVQ
jgi:hypothetical protein